MTRQTHVTIVLQSLAVGGAERLMTDLVRYSDPERYRFSFVVFGSFFALASTLPSTVPVRVVRKTNRLGIGLTRALMNVFRELRPDIVHTNLFTADIWATRAASKLGIPTVLTEHNINVEFSWLHTLLKRYGARSTRYVASSEAIRQYMRKYYAPVEPVVVIRPGVRLEEFLTLPAPRYEKPLQMYILGRLVEQKGHSVALAALAALTTFSWQLTIVGEGVLENALKAQAVKLGIADRVRWQHFTLDVPSALTQADIVLVPSRWEGLGIVAREAMAAGRLVVCSKVHGLVESVTDTTGVLVSAGGARNWVAALRSCFEHPDEAKRLALAGQQKARNEFGVEKTVAAYDQVYQSLLK